MLYVGSTVSLYYALGLRVVDPEHTSQKALAMLLLAGSDKEQRTNDGNMIPDQEQVINSIKVGKEKRERLVPWVSRGSVKTEKRY